MEEETKQMSRAMRAYYKRKNDPERWEAFKAKRREKYQLNPEFKQKQADYFKKYRQTGKGKYNKRITSWITYQQMKSHDWEETYKRYEKTTECELCGVEFSSIKKRNAKILDHDHESGYVRNVCCCKCNNTLGVVDRQKYRLHAELNRYFNRQ